jgi:Uma2 family endonuclease
MAMPAGPSLWTVAMLDELPDDGNRYEIIDGELFVTPSPSNAHQLVVGALHARLRAYLRPTRVARAMISPSDVRRGDHTKNRVQPDIYAVRSAPDEWTEEPFDLRDLILAVEVLSPSNVAYDHQVKRPLYLRGGVAEYWIVDIDARTIAVWRAERVTGELVTTELTWQPEGVDAAFRLDLSEFFEDALG